MHSVHTRRWKRIFADSRVAFRCIPYRHSRVAISSCAFNFSLDPHYFLLANSCSTRPIAYAQISLACAQTHVHKNAQRNRLNVASEPARTGGRLDGQQATTIAGRIFSSRCGDAHVVSSVSRVRSNSSPARPAGCPNPGCPIPNPKPNAGSRPAGESRPGPPGSFRR
jgi:hypothetical protein